MTAGRRGFGWWQWETLVVTMCGYALYYIIRKNFSLAMPALNDAFGISKVQLGAFLTAHGVVYGFSRFFLGMVVDKSSARKALAGGLLLCAGVNAVFGVSDFGARFVQGMLSGCGVSVTFTGALVYVMGVAWVVNGFCQGFGAAPCAKTLPMWFPPRELATKQCIWNFSHSIGAAVAFALCGWFVLPVLGSWRWCFLLPAAISACGAAVVFASMKDSPVDVGFPAVRKESAKPAVTPEEKAAYRAFVRRWVFRNPYIWTIAVADFFVYTVRFAALDWGPTLLVESKGLTLAAATTLCFVFEIAGGNLGMLTAGWVTDRFFGSRSHRTCVFCMLGAAMSIGAFWIVPQDAPFILKLLPFTFIGFFVYGPQALLGVASTQQASPRAAGVAGGLVSIFSYASTVVSGVGFGFVAQHWGWSAAYGTIFAAALASAAVLCMMWKAPAEVKTT